jgi:hypothetical protein
VTDQQRISPTNRLNPAEYGHSGAIRLRAGPGTSRGAHVEAKGECRPRPRSFTPGAEAPGHSTLRDFHADNGIGAALASRSLFRLSARQRVQAVAPKKARHMAGPSFRM